jgi:hypothetical protein
MLTLPATRASDRLLDMIAAKGPNRSVLNTLRLRLEHVMTRGAQHCCYRVQAGCYHQENKGALKVNSLYSRGYKVNTHKVRSAEMYCG